MNPAIPKTALLPCKVVFGGTPTIVRSQVFTPPESTRCIIDGLPLSLYIKDQNHNFIYANKAAAAALGLERAEDAMGRTDRDYFIEELAAEWEEQEKEVLKGNPLVDQVESEILKNSKATPHWVLTCKYPLNDENGRTVGIIGISKQIDKEHEELARKTLAVRGAQVGLWHIKYLANGDKEVWYSPRWKELLGYSDNEILNLPEEFCKRVHPDDFPKITEACDRYFADPRKERHYECEFRIKHKSGSWIWLRSHGEAEFSPDGKTRLAFAGSHSDITAFKDEHELHEEILSRLPALVFMKDEQRRFSFVNPELAHYYGTTKEDIENSRERDSYYNPNKGQTDRFERDDQRVLDDKDPHIRNNGLVIDAEEITNKATGEVRQLKTTKKLFMYPSRDPKKHVLGISTDITDALKRTKDERDKLGKTLDLLTETIVEIDEAEAEQEACLQALRCLESFGKDVGVSSFMISFVREQEGRQAIIADPNLATGKMVDIASKTTRYCDEADEKLDILPWVLFRHEKPYFVEDSRKHPRCKNELCADNDPPIISQYIIPLQSTFSKIGTLQIEVGERTDEPGESAVYRAVAASLSMAIERHRRHKELKDQTVELEHNYNQLRIQTSMITRADIISLLAHNFGHKAIAVTESVRSYSKTCRKALQDRRSVDVLDKPAQEMEAACVEIEGEIGKIQGLSRGVNEKSVVFDVKKVIEETVKTLTSVLAHNNMRVELDCSGNMACYGPKEVFSTALFNLFSNSIDAQKSQDKHRNNFIHINCRLDVQGGGRQIIILFWDDGPGISYHHFPEIGKIFDVGTTSKAEGQGTGTGLPVSRSLLTRFFGADLNIKDRKPPLFEIRLPVNVPNKTKG